MRISWSAVLSVLKFWISPLHLWLLEGLEWCLWSNLSALLGIGHWFTKGKGRVDLCPPHKGFPPKLYSRPICLVRVQNIWCDDAWFQVLLNDEKTERVILAHNSGLEASQEAITEYRVLGPTINGCSWIELRPLTGRKHQVCETH